LVVMVQSIANLSYVEGTVLARRASPRRPGWDDLTVVVELADRVDERADLLGSRLGEEVVITAPRDLLGDAAPGWALRGHVMVGGPGTVLAAPQAVASGGCFEAEPPEE
jgi:hypothetical protein